ncbi:hypothetical protein B0H14DRAFT_2590873 [Mycena olivaceomarginata]|nr:hypothetical protein B0H14DRAFT_2590873 [Mycena olivaceomarginata]
MLPVELAGCCQLPSVGAMGAPMESSQTWDLPPIFGWEHPTFQLNILGAPSNIRNKMFMKQISKSAGRTVQPKLSAKFSVNSDINLGAQYFCGNSVGNGSQLYWYLIGQNEPQDAKGVIELFLREIKWDEYELLKKKIHRDHQDDDGYFSADVEEEEDDNDVGGTKITSFNPFPKPIGSNWFQHIMGPMGVKFSRSSHIQREGPQQLQEVCGLSHIANLGFPFLMWEFPEGHVTGTKQIAILHAFLHILGCKWVNLKALACLNLW